MNERNFPVETATVVANLMAGLPKRMNCTVHSINIQLGINLYKYKNGSTFPLISTFLSFCLALNVDPGWVLFLACEVQKNKLTETQASEILATCHGHHPVVSTAYQIVLQEIMNKS